MLFGEFMSETMRKTGFNKTKDVVRGGLTLFLGIMLFACQDRIPDAEKTLEAMPCIYPDYCGLKIPYNMAPLNFEINEDGEDYVTVISAGDSHPIVVKGKKVKIDCKQWSKLLTSQKGNSIAVDVYVKQAKKWNKFRSINNVISKDKIDDYIAYRLIEPGYVYYTDIFIMQRNMTNFDEQVIYDNALMRTNKDGQCANCHSFQNYNKGNHFQIHIRGTYGGTVIEEDGYFKKVNLKTDSTISGGVYPAWHPTKNIIAYSVNDIGQIFHTKDPQKIEVQDTKSDIVVYDVDNNEVKFVAHDDDKLETFPYWTPSGDALLYASASYIPTGDDIQLDIALKYKQMYYNIMKVDYDTLTGQFGKTDTLFNAAAIRKSATFPRMSPDGRYLLFTLADFGNFHIWHKSSDLYLLDMSNHKMRNAVEINSNDSESYHSWSSNGKWVIFSSRRDDGSYTRFYVSHFDNGSFSKPFIIPQKDPDFYHQFFKSFNIPEFMVKPVDFEAHDLPRVIKKKAIKANYKE